MLTWKELIHKAGGQAVRNDEAQKDYFLGFHSVLKKEEGRKELHKQMVEHARTTLPELEVQRMVVTYINYANSYASMNAVTNLKKMRWYNIKRIIQFIRFMDKKHPDEVSKVKGRITKVWESGMSAHRYNTMLTKELDKLKEEYGVKDVDGELMEFNAKALVAKLTPTQRLELLNELMAVADIQVTNTEKEVG